MKTIKISASDIQGPFITPPENAGQIVEVSYACTEDYILQLTEDRSDRSSEIIAYGWPASGEFTPQCRVPRLGRKMGAVKLD